uniref:Uncharacterized protein n=1 Tax=Oryza sativa subsp. japonica TaxID=39947 RepID=Q84TA7_ORYSJ|nr:hypothetical protein [Oryza sativa Japonica Group]
MGIFIQVRAPQLSVAPDFNANERIHILDRRPWSNCYRAQVTVLGSDKALSALGVPSRSFLRFLGGLVKTASRDSRIGFNARCHRGKGSLGKTLGDLVYLISTLLE